jgi:hypothetical protein
MKKFLGVAALLLAFAMPGFAQGHRLSPEDQSKFDSYYSRWIQYKQTNNRDQERSMEERMRDVMARNGIPGDVPFERVASNGGYGDRDRARDSDHDRDRDHDRDGDHDRDRGGDRWQGRLSPEAQRDFNSYYSRWQEYRESNNREQMHSMEERMEDLKARNNIPQNVPNDVIASGGRRY